MKGNESSSTAQTVLLGLIHTSKKEEFKHLVSDDMGAACESILNATESGRNRLRKLDKGWFKTGAELIESLMMPNIMLHYALRKKYIEEHVVKSINSGTTQVISLGAGFDTLAFRLSKINTDVNFIEIDHPATHTTKKQALNIEAENRTNFHFLPVDFTKDNLVDKLTGASFYSPKKVTLFIIEGVLMYLSVSQIQALFQSITELSKAKSEVIFTAVQPESKDVQSYGVLLKLYLKIKGEPLYWNCAKKDMDGFLKTMNYKLHGIGASEDFKKQYIPNYKKRLHEGEYIAIASPITD